MTDSWRGYEMHGGHIVIDLVNTVSWRLEPTRTFDRMDKPDFLPLWLSRTGLLPDVAEIDPETVASLIRLRETVYRLLVATDEADVVQFGSWLTAASRLVVAEPSLPLRWAVAVRRPDDVVPALTIAANELLASPDTALVRQCAGPGCGWLFIDRTRNHSRQWCSSQDCGNRERARRHYRKSRRADADSPG
nr:CGNR zinc finger domain-containing protein [Kibdelosporangium sp. MJ126-NF4]CEL20810.1 Conserved protein containing a Zn-ribbon-like motif, possibly RNA-binding [Kibdelosporangium sp. MJ126-NF4]CTQ98385.1 Conserved protein containing a Zn-ribbon-like motif, possibly RNA-binding [Kibdelosporangium sp. MJ126-NF4]